MLVTVTVAADKSCSRADGGSMILSPRRGGVDAAGRTNSCVDHLRGGRCGSELMADGRGGAQRMMRYDAAACCMTKT